MVQERTKSIIFQICSRIILLIISLIIGLYFFPLTIHQYVLDVLNYEVPPGFFGFTLADWDIAWNLSSSLILGIIFGTLGKRIDYIFIIGMFLLFLLDFFFTENITLIMYLNLVGFTVGGNAIGFILKLLRQRFFR